MEALALLIVIGVLCSLASKSNEKKKKQGKARPAAQTMRKQMPQRPLEDTAPEDADVDDTEMQEAEDAPAPVQQAFLLEGEDPCHEDMLPQRPAPAAPGSVVIGPEGRDACHDYMLRKPAPAPLPEPMPMQEEDTENTAAQELLRGVILSEVLQRPAPKAYRRKL